jgi:hypothetical protein
MKRGFSIVVPSILEGKGTFDLTLTHKDGFSTEVPSILEGEESSDLALTPL